MRRIAIVLLALALAGCAGIQNPLTDARLTAIEASYGSALVALNGYKSLCVQRAIPPSCRTAVRQLQSAIIPVQSAVVSARRFISAGDNVSAATAISAAQSAFANFQALKATYGVQ